MEEMYPRATIASSAMNDSHIMGKNVLNTAVLWRATPRREFYDLTLLKQVEVANKHNLDATAISFFNQTITYKELIEKTLCLIDAFKKLGIQEGDVVPICTITSPAVVFILLALNEIGAVSMWLYADSTKSEISKYVSLAKAKVFITGVGEEILNGLNLSTIIKIGTSQVSSSPENGRNVISFETLLKSGEAISDYKGVPYNGKRPCLIVQSSGTTGAPKLIVHTLGNVRNFLEKYNHTDWDLNEGKIALLSLPTWVAYGLTNGLYASLCLGMEVRLVIEPSKKGFVAVYENISGIDVAFTTPWHLRYAMEHLDSEKKSEIKFSTIVTGGDKIEADEVIEMEKAFGVMPVNGCGNSENLAGVVANPQHHNKPGSVGVPLWGNSVCIIDTETGDLLPLGKNADGTYNIGEICYHTDTMFSSYLGMPEATRKATFLDHDMQTWMHSNDLGYIDDEGYLFIQGRLSEVIQRGPDKISADSIDEPLYSHCKGKIKLCKTVGAHDNSKGKVPVTFVVPKEERTDMRQELLEELEAVKEAYIKATYWPEHIIIIPEAEMPFTKTGKPHIKILEEIANDYHQKHSK